MARNASKRQNTGSAEDKSDDGFTSDDDVRGMLVKLRESEGKARAEQRAQMAAATEESNARFTGQLSDLVDKMDRRVNLEARYALLEKRQDDQGKRVDELASQLMVAKQQTIERKHLDDDRLDRPRNLEVLYITCRTFLSVDAISTAVAPWLHSAHSLEPEQWTLVRANPPGKRFMLKFLFFAAAKRTHC